jgi:hypothetical protein
VFGPELAMATHPSRRFCALRFAARVPSAEWKGSVFRFSARLKSGPDTCVAWGRIVIRDAFGNLLLAAESAKAPASGVAAYGAHNHFFVLTQGLTRLVLCLRNSFTLEQRLSLRKP